MYLLLEVYKLSSNVRSGRKYHSASISKLAFNCWALWCFLQEASFRSTCDEADGTGGFLHIVIFERTRKDFLDTEAMSSTRTEGIWRLQSSPAAKQINTEAFICFVVTDGDRVWLFTNSTTVATFDTKALARLNTSNLDIVQIKGCIDTETSVAKIVRHDSYDQTSI